MKSINVLVLFIAIIFAIGCDNTDEPTPVNPLDELTEVYTETVQDGDYIITVYMSEEPFVGFNNVYVAVADVATNNQVTDWEVEFAPLMTMMMESGTMQHSCPIEQPELNEEYKVVQGALVFVMPTTPMGTWELKLNYNSMDVEGSISFPVTVVEKEESQLISFVSDFDQSKYFVTLIQPTAPAVGINDFELGIYTKESMMSFPAANNVEVKIEPEMPSMDHGSPNNVDPEPMGEGHYMGKVNFTMSGMWHVNLNIMDENSNVHADDKYFQIEF